MSKVDTFWHYNTADKEEEDNSCIAHLADGCRRRLVVSCDVSNELTCAISLSFYTALVHVS